MKRFLAVVLSACLLFVGCGTQAGVKETAKDTYEKINAAADSSDLIMSSVLAAWYFAIDEGDEYATNFEAGCLAFKTEVGIPASCDVKTIMTEIVEPTPSGAVMAQLSMMGMAFSEPSYCVACALKCLEQEEITTTLETVMGEAKDNLKELADKNTDLEGLDQLKKYYSEVESYRQFAMNPTGSYVDAKSTAETYRTNIKNYKNELSIDFE